MRNLWHALEQRLPLNAFFKKHILSYQVSSRLNVWYVFGLLALIVLFNQYLSGIWLAMFYVPHVEYAFTSIINLMHDVPAGWFIRYLHTTGASMLFVVLYAHMFRGFLYGSYQKPRELVWVLGSVLLLILYLQAFFGYVLPWGQMSFWGAEVATSTLNGLPWIGSSLLRWLRGGLELGSPLLQRFYALHVIALPLLLLYVIKIHIVAIRYVGSSTPAEEDPEGKRIRFFPDHIAKESFFVAIFISIFFGIVFFNPDVWGIFIEPNNAIPADPLQTPQTIHPPWYIGPYFVILRSIPDLGIGLIITLLSLGAWVFLPWLDKSPVRTLAAKPRRFRVGVYLFWINFIMLGILAWFELNAWTIWMARFGTFYYLMFFMSLPWLSRK